MGKTYCPICGSEDVERREDGKFSCLDCGNVGVFPKRKSLIEDDMDDESADEEILSNKKMKAKKMEKNKKEKKAVNGKKIKDKKKGKKK